MERIPAPTLDQITGYTVMEKIRSLIKNYVATTTQIIDRVEDTVTQEEIATYLEQYLSDYYTKEEVDELISHIDLSNYYNKSETDTLLSTKANSNNVYTKSEVYNKTETDNLLSTKANANNVYTKSEVYTKNEVYNTTEVYNMQEVNNLLNDKQDELTAGTGITIQNNVISAPGSNANVKMITLGARNTGTSYELGNVEDGDTVVLKFTGTFGGVTVVVINIHFDSISDEYMYTVNILSGNLNKYCIHTSYMNNLLYVSFMHTSYPLDGGSQSISTEIPPNDLTGYILRRV